MKINNLRLKIIILQSYGKKGEDLCKIVAKIFRVVTWIREDDADELPVLMMIGRAPPADYCGTRGPAYLSSGDSDGQNNSEKA
jgi:hypothetical protein